MFARLIRTLAALGFAAVSFTACDRPATTAPATNSVSGAVSDTSLPSPPRPGRGQGEAPKNTGDRSTLHWLGKKRLAADTNAASVMAIWNLPETAKLGAQTLDKLALAPWRLLKNDAATNGAPVALLRPLLDDLVNEESHLTIQHPTNAPAGWSLAVRLPAARSQLWQTNLAAVLESLTGGKAAQTSDGFTCPSAIVHPPSSNIVFRLTRTNDWTILSYALQNSKPETRNSELGTNWLSLSLDPAALNRAFSFGWSLPANCPRVELDFTGDGQNVQTRGLISFSRPHALQLEPWRIPTNKISEPLIGFTAIRGLRHGGLLAGLSADFGASVSQVFCWSLASTPFASYLALPATNCAALVAELSGAAIGDVNQAIKAPRMGRFQRAPDGNGVAWVELPYFAPFLQKDGDFILGGLLALPSHSGNLPSELFTQLDTETNLVYYEWEATGAKTESVLHISQLLRFIFGRAQLPLDSAVVQCLRTLQIYVRESVTTARLLNPNDIELIRRSSSGFNSLELNLLADWLASPGFPRGLRTLEAMPETAQRRNRTVTPNLQSSPR